MSLTITNQDIIKYYDECESDYKLLWHLGEQSALHYGFWKADTRLLRDALRNMNDYVLDMLGLKPGEQYLDAGCGIGGTAMYATSKCRCSVHGISLSEKQIQTAKFKSGSKNLIGSVDFSVQNFCNTSFDSASFDGVYGIESICHAFDKKSFFLEAYRLLKSGGQLVVADFFESKHNMEPAEKNLMAKWAESWAVPSFSNFENFIQDAENIGLKLVENNNISQAIQKTARRLYYCFFPGLLCHGFLRMFGLRKKTQGRNVWSTYYQYKSLQNKLWDYRVMKFVKN